MVRQTLSWYIYGGSRGTLEEYLSTLYDGGTTQEWHEYGGSPYFFKAIVTISQDREKSERRPRYYKEDKEI